MTQLRLGRKSKQRKALTHAQAWIQESCRGKGRSNWWAEITLRACRIAPDTAAQWTASGP
jgi:hypothetical protein